MIISHRYQFVFLHVPKMAGSAIKVTLLRHLGPDDLILGVLDDALMQGVWPNRRTWRHVLRPHSVAWFRKALLVPFGGRRSLAGFLNWANKRHFRERYGLLTHSGAEECRRAFPREFAAYRRFAVTRNPWDHFASAYFWRYRKLPESQRPTFEAFVSAVHGNCREHRGADFRRKLGDAFYFLDDGEFALTHTLRFESLAADWQALVDELGLPQAARLAVAKADTRKGRPYRPLYNDRTRRMVAELCEREIERFGYRF